MVRTVGLTKLSPLPPSHVPRYEEMDAGPSDGKVDRVAMMVLEGACRTNEFVDAVTMGTSAVGKPMSTKRRGRDLSVGEELVVMLAGEKRMTGEEFGRVRERLQRMKGERRETRQRERNRGRRRKN